MKQAIGSDPSFSVSEFIVVFNQSLEMMYPRVSIIGELANFRISKGRWVYFDLKDESASLKFFGSINKLPGPLEDGLNLEVFGYPRLHSQYGFSINFEQMNVVGEGSITKAQKLLEAKLTKEGLFDPARKRVLPLPPQRIGLITSVESAAYGDFIKIINQRWGNLRIQLVDCLVQGNDAPAQIIGAIEKLNQMPVPPETLVLIRGGGSADDLAVFSTEQVVRAVAASRVPTLVGVGHETDVSLAELAADRRASTPSNAAELLVPDKSSEANLLRIKQKRLREFLASIFAREKELIDAKKASLSNTLQQKYSGAAAIFDQQKNLLRTLDPAFPLSRGYAIARDVRGKAISSIKPINIGDGVSVDLRDGRLHAKVEKKQVKNA